MRKYVWFFVLLIVIIFACGEVVRSDIVFGAVTGGDDETGLSGDDDDDGGGVATGGSGDSSDSDGDKFDFGEPPDSLIDEEKCKKIDFIFIIDDSGSMIDEQMNLINSFPGFIAGVVGYVPTIESFHLGITTTAMPVGNPPMCQKKGAFLTSTVGAGSNSSESICGPYTDGYNFMTQNDDLNIAFPCAAQVGTHGPFNEQPLMSLVESLELFIQSPSQCNDGFTQEDSLLVVVIITDEDDQSGGTIFNWYDHLTWLKGSQDDIVILSLCNTENCSMGNTISESTSLMDFTNLFTHGFIGDVCAPTYDLFFWDALGVIQEACRAPIG